MHAYRSFVAALTSLALAVQVPLSALAAGADFAPVANDDIARRCDVFSSVYDRQYSGPRTVLDDNSVAEALRVCAQAAEARPVRSRYVYLYGAALSVAKRHAEAAQQFAAARQAGNAWGAYGLGWFSAQGLGEPKNLEKAASLYREAASAGVAAANSNLGWLYENGAGVPRDANEAMRLYRRAADGGVAPAYARLMWLSLGTTPPSYTEVARWAQQAADAGYGDGAHVLGWCYLMGNGVRRDPALAAKWYVEAARRGSVDAMYELSLMARDGVGLPKDAHDAAGWMLQAAEHGDAQAQLELARMLIAGTGVASDPRAAYGWALAAAKAELVPAQVLVASMAYDGTGVARNRAEAATWFRRAADHGDTFAMYQLGWLVRNGDGTPRSEGDAVRWFLEAANRGNASAEESLGEGYMNGLGGRSPDYRAAVYWLERAASKGDGFAQLNLGSLYADGKGVPRDMQRARSLFVKATLSPDPRVARKANENLSAMLHGSPPARDRDDTTAAVVGVALVGLALLWAFSGSGESSESGGGTPTNTAPCCGGSPSTSPPRPTPDMAPTRPPVPGPMVGNIGRTRMGDITSMPPVVGR
ncbi:MAG TPA: tetratricopeptide repeat protein [Caldimonas sp.]|nr:tetratricopeptide repeat protein [Caldimonas sp.]